jgi:beta-lactamase class A
MLGLAGAGFWGVQRLRPQPEVSQTPSSSPNLQPSSAAAVIHPPSTEQKQTFETLAYNVQPEAPMPRSEELQAIVDGAVALAASKSLDTQPLSITLIDLKGNTIAGYQQDTPRYPASVVKLFWLAVCEAQLDQGILQPDANLNADLIAMIVHSDNDAASRIFDRITQTTSGNSLGGTEYETWLKNRLRINQFFRAAGYEGLSISQKNYPIYSLKLDGPNGRELQMLDEQQQPIRSLVTSDQAARLMSEIYAGKAVSASRSQEMMGLLTRDLNPESWKKQADNAIAGFLGEPLPADVRFASKVGMTTKVRHEVAFIESKDGSVAYILAVFGTDPTYSQNSEILPAISKAVYTQMVERSAHANVTKGTDG